MQAKRSVALALLLHCHLKMISCFRKKYEEALFKNDLQAQQNINFKISSEIMRKPVRWRTTEKLCLSFYCIWNRNTTNKILKKSRNGFLKLDKHGVIFSVSDCLPLCGFPFYYFGISRLNMQYVLPFNAVKLKLHYTERLFTQSKQLSLMLRSCLQDPPEVTEIQK